MPSQTRRNAPVPIFGSASRSRPAIVSPSSHCIRSISNGLIRTVCGGNGQCLLWSAFALTMASKFLASAVTLPKLPPGGEAVSVLATASAIAVAALAPVSVSASAGPVTATLTATGASSGTTITGATGIRVTIARQGAIAFAGPLRACRFGCEPDDPTGARFAQIAVADLDGDGEPGVLAARADGSPPCGTREPATLPRSRATGAYAELARHWGESYRIADLDGDRVPELVTAD